MGSYDVTFNVSDLIAFFEGKISNLPEMATSLLDGIGEDIRGEMVDEAPYKWGDLRAGHTIESPSEWVRVMFSDVPHFDWVVGGTKPHIIEGNPWLYWEGAEHPVRRVHHPGTAPNDYPARALENAQTGIEERINDFLNKITE